MSVFICLLALITTATSTSQKLSCIGEDEVEGIAQRWLNAFATGGINGLPNAVTDNVCKPYQDISAVITELTMLARFISTTKAFRMDLQYRSSRITTSSGNPSVHRHMEAVV